MIKEGCVMAARALGRKTSYGDCLCHFQLGHLKEGVASPEEIEEVVPLVQIAGNLFRGKRATGIHVSPFCEILRTAVGAVQDRQKQSVERHGDQWRVIANLPQFVRLQERVADAVLDTPTLRIDARN